MTPPKVATPQIRHRIVLNLRRCVGPERADSRHGFCRSRTLVRFCNGFGKPGSKPTGIYC